MTERKYIISLLTWCSLLLFIVLIVTASLTPLSQTSAGANEFNTTGMYTSIGLITFIYIIPYSLYAVGLRAVKYVMAILCLFGCLIAFATCLTIAGAMYWMSEPFYYFLIPFIVSFFMLCVDLIWLVAVFITKDHHDQAI